MSASNRTRRVAGAAFWAALLIILALTLAPIQGSGLGIDDKLAHFVGFFGLALLGVLAWGRPALLVLAIALPMVGALIELLQAMPQIQRDGDVGDWLADVAGVAAVLTSAWAVMRTKKRQFLA